MEYDLAPESSISVYVHIPFCTSRCRYCDFSVVTGASPRMINLTLDRTLEEASWYVERMGRPRIRTIYIGGGTPSLIAPERLARFLEGLTQRLGVDGSLEEWTIEANPETVTADFLAAASAAGVDRLSLGIQSFQDRLLRRLGRRANAARIDAALECIAAHWSGRLTVDVITGTPAQTLIDLDDDLTRLAALAPGHVSLYSLTIEPGTPLARAIERGSVTPLPGELQDELWIAARDRLVAIGYRWYEVSNFALPGCESKHNAVYWRSEPYLGLGPGAVGTVRAVDPANPTLTVRLTNPDMSVYAAAAGDAWTRDVEVIDARTLLFEHFMLGLRTEEGVHLGRLASVFGLDETSVVALLRRCPELWIHIDPCSLREGRVALQPDGRLLADGLLASFFPVIDGSGVPDCQPDPFSPPDP
jgi:oxygen-independent coproporphyrinogen III oxidase